MESEFRRLPIALQDGFHDSVNLLQAQNLLASFRDLLLSQITRTKVWNLLKEAAWTSH